MSPPVRGIEEKFARMPGKIKEMCMQLPLASKDTHSLYERCVVKSDAYFQRFREIRSHKRG